MAVYSFQMGITGQGSNLINLGQTLQPPSSQIVLVDVSQNTSLPLPDGTYTVTGQIFANAEKLSGPTAATIDFSSTGAFTFGASAVSEPGSASLLAIAVALGGAGHISRRGRLGRELNLD
jgi:hypothetical protein